MRIIEAPTSFGTFTLTTPTGPDPSTVADDGSDWYIMNVGAGQADVSGRTRGVIILTWQPMLMLMYSSYTQILYSRTRRPQHMAEKEMYTYRVKWPQTSSHENVTAAGFATLRFFTHDAYGLSVNLACTKIGLIILDILIDPLSLPTVICPVRCLRGPISPNAL